MTKGQAWILIVLVGVIVFIWMINNKHETDRKVNQALACYKPCNDTYYREAGVTKTIEQAISESSACINQCNIQNGLGNSR